MKNITLPCFYYPTTVTIIDDNEIFLDNFINNLNNDIPYKKFNCPKEALFFLKNQLQISPSSQEFIQLSTHLSDEFIHPGKSIININFSDIHNKLYDSNRHNLTSVIVVDHDMPSMNGIDFCKSLINFPIKKIMLTGAADHKVAIKAFNEGIIDKFILKDDPDVFQSIDNAIFELQQEYFSNLSELIIRNITATSYSYLENEKFIHFFHNIIQSNNIVEWYLIDSLGSFIFLNKKSELLWLIIKSTYDIESDYQIAQDQNANPDIINMLKDKKKLLFLFSEDDYKKPVEKWISHLHNTTTIDEIPDCYYILIKGEEARSISGINNNAIHFFRNN